MRDYDFNDEPEWNIPVNIQTTPGTIIDCVFWNADSVHTGHESCIDEKFVLMNIIAREDHGGNYCRYVEQEYTIDPEYMQETEEGSDKEELEEEKALSDATWHDWSVELKLGEVFVTAHWRVLVTGSFSDRSWCAQESEKAFTVGSVLMGKRVRQSIVVEAPSYQPQSTQTQH